MGHRPVYERESHRVGEREAGDIFKDMGFRVYHLGNKQYPDLYIVKDKRKILVEVKHRKIRSTDWATYMISAAKIQKYIALCKQYKMELMLTIKFTDGYFVAPIFDNDYPVIVQGRKDRNDPQDTELMALIPMEHFTPISARMDIYA